MDAGPRSTASLELNGMASTLASGSRQAMATAVRNT